MKLIDIWKSSTKPTLSFELFPARTEKGATKLETTIDELAALKPDFVSVTFGAGGSTREGSHQLVRKLKKLGKNVEIWAFKYSLANVLKEEVGNKNTYYLDEILNELKVHNNYNK